MLATSQCERRRCRWLAGVIQPDGTEKSERMVCPAFPDGIPRDIAFGSDPHTARDDRQVGPQVFTPLVAVRPLGAAGAVGLMDVAPVSDALSDARVDALFATVSLAAAYDPEERHQRTLKAWETRRRKAQERAAQAAPAAPPVQTASDADRVLETIQRPTTRRSTSSGQLDYETNHTNPVLHVTYADGTEHLFKPVDGEKFKAYGDWVRHTITNQSATLAEREVLSYALAAELGIGDIIPKAEMVEADGKLGAGIEWMKNATNPTDLTEPRDTPELKAYWAKVGILDAVIANTDRHWQNYMLVQKPGDAGRVPVAIDHGYAFGNAPVLGDANSQSYHDFRSRHHDVYLDAGGVPELRSFALAHIKDGDLPKAQQKALAAKLDALSTRLPTVLQHAHLDADERASLAERIGLVADFLRRGAAHEIQSLFKADAY
jgi:hypothetical protein